MLFWERGRGRGRSHSQKRRRQRDSGGRDWRGVASSQEILAASGSQKRRRADSLLEHLEGLQLCWHLDSHLEYEFWISGLQKCGRTHFCGFKPLRCVIIVATSGNCMTIIAIWHNYTELSNQINKFVGDGVPQPLGENERFSMCAGGIWEGFFKEQCLEKGSLFQVWKAKRMPNPGGKFKQYLKSKRK